MSRSPARPSRRRFQHKFRDALKGLRCSLPGQSSYRVHAAATLAVLLAGWWLRVTALEWSVLLVCITLVWTAELFNSALEFLAQAVTDQYQPHVGRALDTASAAVLVSAVGASLVGTVILGYRLAVYLGWWSLDMPLG